MLSVLVLACEEWGCWVCWFWHVREALADGNTMFGVTPNHAFEQGYYWVAVVHVVACRWACLCGHVREEFADGVVRYSVTPQAGSYEDLLEMAKARVWQCMAM